MSELEPTPPASKPMLSDKQYNVLKFIALIFLPALGALYYGLAAIWGLPHADEVVGTIVTVDTFLGVLLGLSTKVYNDSDARYDGELVVGQEEGGDVFNLVVKDDPYALVDKKEIVFKVNPPS